MPDPDYAIHRRGAAFTFDGEGFQALVKSLRGASDIAEPTTVYALSFDHATKDPVENGISVIGRTRIVIFEENYLSLDRQPWKATASLMDQLWFVEVDREVARERLIKRHAVSGICPDEETARHRVASTDFLNAVDMLETLLPADEVFTCGQ